jgi:tricorn protease-like protein
MVSCEFLTFAFKKKGQTAREEVFRVRIYESTGLVSAYRVKLDGSKDSEELLAANSKGKIEKYNKEKWQRIRIEVKVDSLRITANGKEICQVNKVKDMAGDLERIRIRVVGGKVLLDEFELYQGN